MKIYRFALTKKLVKQIRDGAEERPFPKLFGDKKRIVIPLKNKALLRIVSLLEQGETATETKYKVDMENKVAYRYVNKDGKIVLDPRPMRIGKVIFKELGKEASDEWSIQSNSIQDQDYSIILSRDPIDVARMSDHYGIRSCHSPSREYFSSAQQEALNGGAIAYLVRNRDLKEFLKEEGEEALQEDEIFEDSQRNIRGIEPVTRLRINKYFHEDEPDNQIALPINRLYGVDNVAGFFDSVKQFLYSEQEKFIDFNNIKMTDYKRGGGDYADERDKEIMMGFFGEDKGVKRDLDHDGSSNMADLYNEEFTAISKEINNKLSYSIVYADAEVDQDMYISSGVIITFRVRGELLNETRYLPWDKRKSLEENLHLYSEIEIDEINLDPKGDIVEISVRGNFHDSGYGGIRNPDDFRRSAEEIIDYEDKHYMSDLYTVRDFLIRSHIIDARNVDKRDNNFKGLASQLGGSIAYDNGIVEMGIPLNFRLKDEISGYIHYDDRIRLKNEISKFFIDAIKRELLSYYEREKQQMKFDFFSEDMSEVKRALDYVPKFQISYNRAAEESGANLENRQMIISIPETELIEAGQTYFNMFIDMLPRIYNEILRFIQYKYAEKSNVGYNKEWSKYLKDRELEDKRRMPPQTELTLPPKQNNQGGEDIQQKQDSGEVVPANNRSWYKIAVKCEAHS